MGDEILNMLRDELKTVNAKLDVLLPNQAIIEERTKILLDTQKEQTKEIKENFEKSLAYAKEKVNEHVRACSNKGDIDVKKLKVITSALAGGITLIISIAFEIFNTRRWLYCICLKKLEKDWWRKKDSKKIGIYAKKAKKQ